MKEYQNISHGFGPVYNSESRILILGSFPSVKSREQAFFYGHPLESVLEGAGGSAERGGATDGGREKGDSFSGAVLPCMM